MAAATSTLPVREEFKQKTSVQSKLTTALRKLIQELMATKKFDPYNVYSMGLFFYERARDGRLVGFQSSSMKIWANLMAYLRLLGGVVSVDNWDSKELDDIVSRMPKEGDRKGFIAEKLKKDMLRYARKLYVSERSDDLNIYNKLLKLEEFTVPYF